MIDNTVDMNDFNIRSIEIIFYSGCVIEVQNAIAFLRLKVTILHDSSIDLLNPHIKLLF